MSPDFEVMGNRRRTDSTFVKMRTTKARDNAMYRLTDTWNLDQPKDKPRKETLYEQYLSERLDTAGTQWCKEQYSAVPPTATKHTARSYFKPGTTGGRMASTARADDASTATESTTKR